MLCHKCGADVSNKSKYCPACGAQLFNSSNTENNVLNTAKPEEPKKKKKFSWVFIFIILAFAILFLLPQCFFGHEWSEATCVEPETCTRCGDTIGKALGHKWSEATCTEPEICTICGTVGKEAPGHKWSEATCLSLSTCSVCGETQGKLAGHKWKNATCSSPKICSICKKTEGQPLEHSWSPATDIDPQTCVNCGLMQPLPRPRTGEVFEGKNKSLSSTLLTKNETELDAYIILKDAQSTVVYSFYIRANEKKYVPVPSGEFYLYLSQGTEWFGPENYFGEGTKPYRDSNLMDFNTYWWTYTLT